MSFSAAIKALKKKSNKLRFVVVGLDNSGKTTIVESLINENMNKNKDKNNFIENDISKISPTFGYSMKHFNYKNKNITLIDVGGQECLRKYWSNFYDDISGVIFVFDIFDTRDFLVELNNVKEILFDYKFLLLGNKSDLDPFKADSIINNIKQGLDDDTLCFKVSGKSGENIQFAFERFIEKIGSG